MPKRQRRTQCHGVKAAELKRMSKGQRGGSIDGGEWGGARPRTNSPVDCRGKRMRRASLLLDRKDGLAA